MQNKKLLKIVRNIAIAAGTITASIAITNQIVFKLSTCHEYLNIRGSFFEWRFGKVFYKTFGSGSPILLIHDLSPDSSGYEWNQIVDDLSKHHTVYVLDLLGCGRSDKPAISYTSYLYVQLLSDFVKNIIRCKTDIIATGLSASFVMMACNSEPELFRQLIFINPESLTKTACAPNKRSKTAKFIIETPLFGTGIYNLAIRKSNIRKKFHKEYFFNKKKCSSKNIRNYCEAAHLQKGNARYLYASLIGRYLNINPVSALKQSNHSILLIGSKEMPNTETILTTYQEINPAIEISYISDCKKLPQLENPKEFLNTIEIYL